MNRTTLTLALLTVVALSPAHADWQYTKWGMTLEEVKQASGGKAVEARELDDPNINPNILLLKAPYQAGGINLPAYFYFERGAVYPRKLVEVQLRPSKGDTDKVLTALKAKYGEPTSKAEVEKGNLLSSIKMLEYTWITDGDTIIFSVFAGRGTVKYMPRNAALDSGL